MYINIQIICRDNDPILRLCGWHLNFSSILIDGSDIDSFQTADVATAHLSVKKAMKAESFITWCTGKKTISVKSPINIKSNCTVYIIF